MTNAEKLAMVKTLLGIAASDTSEDDLITVYLDAAAKEIIAWRFSYADREEAVTDVPAEYEMTQVYAVIAGYSQSGAENQKSHSENGINRVFSYPDMIAYIRANVIAMVRVI